MAEMSDSTRLKVLAIVLAVVVLTSLIAWSVLVGRHDGPMLVPDAMVSIDAGGENVTFSCEVADTEAERATGLMNRESLDPDAGMLFVFDESREVTFWMKNTLIPLDIIFIAENGTVVNIAEAVPEPGVPDGNLTLYDSAGPVKWVLEVNIGTCSANGIVPGAAVCIAYREVNV